MVVDRRAMANMAYLDYFRKYLPTIVTDEALYSAIKNMLSPIFENLRMCGKGTAWYQALTSWKGPALFKLDAQSKRKGQEVCVRRDCKGRLIRWTACAGRAEGRLFAKRRRRRCQRLSHSS